MKKKYAKFLKKCDFFQIYNLKNQILYCIFFCALYFSSTAQVHTIYLEDSAYYVSDIYYLHEKLKDSLSDGLWVLHNLYKADSLKACVASIATVGAYKNYKKNGIFNRYTQSTLKYQRGQFYHPLEYIYETDTYTNGKLDGLSIRRVAGKVEKSIKYSDGEKDGLVIRNNYNNKGMLSVQRIMYFKEDTLIERQDFIYGKLVGTLKRIREGEYVQTIYDTTYSGFLEWIIYVRNYRIYKYQQFYPNQVLSFDAEGEFVEDNFSIEVLSLLSDNNCVVLGWNVPHAIILKGTEKFYDQKGNLVQECVYE